MNKEHENVIREILRSEIANLPEYGVEFGAVNNENNRKIIAKQVTRLLGEIASNDADFEVTTTLSGDIVNVDITTTDPVIIELLRNIEEDDE